MKKIHVLYGAIIGVLLLVIAGLVYKFLLAGKTVTTEDRRTAIIMEPAERAFVLEEMRALLDAIRAMTDAVARDDMKKVAVAARAVGLAAAQHVPAAVAAKLPLEFKTMGRGVHAEFDRIALDAEALGDGKHTLTQMGELLGRCVACHAIYQINPAAVPPK